MKLSKKKYTPSKFELMFAKLVFGYGARVEFYNQILALRDAGLTFTEALENSYEVASLEGKQPNGTMAIIINDMLQTSKNGEGLAAAVRPWVPKDDAMIFEAIGESPTFVEDLRTYLKMMHLKKSIRGTIVGGLTYPIFLSLIVVALMVYFGKEVVPEVGQLLPMEDWTGISVFLRFLNTFALELVKPVMIGIVATVALILFLLPRWAKNGRGIADKLPIFSVYKMYTGLSFLMSVASMMQSGMLPIDAINRLRPTASPYVEHRLAQIRKQLANGADFGSSLQAAGTGWPDEDMNLSIKVFSATNDLGKQLTRLAMTWVSQSHEKVEKSMSLARNGALIGVTGVILLIVAGIFSLQDQIAAAMQ